ncbi:uncharacterized protein LOC123008920 [Tribolium madens]|uniref:uncharacterized protein LOC123008920 n=1 Tax=Tribolium madens TaxID=41895 RepID=UPI001CF7469A|nr:uncharacterized protein LOC123008920 [Tribolium madens]
MAFKDLLVVFTLISCTEAATKCYKCTTTKPSLYSNETVRLCSEFDYSEKFIVDCPYSTFCMKRDFSAKIPVPINATERDCAHQKLMTQNFKNGFWQPEVVVEEPYTEGCSVVDDKGVRTSTTVECYCKSYLCNGADIYHFKALPAVIISVMTYFL